MKTKLIAIMMAGTVALAGCAVTKSIDNEGTEQKIEENKSEESEEQTAKDAEKEEDSKIVNEVNIEEVGAKLQTYIEDHESTFKDITGYRFVNITDDGIPELLYTDQKGLKGIMRYDGDKIYLCTGEKDIHEIDRYGCAANAISSAEGVDLTLYYGEMSNKFAVFLHVETDSDEKRSASDKDRNNFFEISGGELIDVTKTERYKLDQEDTMFTTADSPQYKSTRERYDEINEKYYEGLDEKVDLINDMYMTFDEALEAYKSE